MRVWILSTALAAAVLAFAPAAALAAPTPTAQPTALSKASAPPTVTPVPPKPSPTAARAAPTATPAPPTPTAVAPTAAPARAQAQLVAPTSPTQGAAPSAAPTSAPTARPATAPQKGSVHGTVFNDANADGQPSDGESGIAQFTVTLTGGNGSRTTVTDDTGAFSFAGLVPGRYHLSIDVPSDLVPTTDAGQDVQVPAGPDTAEVGFGLITAASAGLTTDNASATPDVPTDAVDDEQVIALSSVTSLPLRFAEGRDLMNQVQRRVLGDGLIWLGVPFRSQIDGGNFQYVNCGPASLTMVLAAFGLDVGPSQVRDYLNNMIDNFDTDLGTSLDALSRIAKMAGLTPMDLYSDQGGYRNWSTDAVRWHVQQGHPVITLVKYRNLPGHSSSLSDWDHYIVISGLTPNGFIYNDAAFATTLGYGLEISDVELEYAWENSSIPHHALALGLDPDQKTVSFPEAPRPRRAVADAAPSRSVLRQAQADESQRAPLTFTPPAPVVSPAGPLITTSDRWEDDPDVTPPDDVGAPMGLNMQATDTPAVEPRPGPGAEVPKLLVLLGPLWLLWAVWTFSGKLVPRGLLLSSRKR